MRMLRTAFLCTLLASVAQASSAVQLDVHALARAASQVVRARVVSRRCAWADGHRRLVTFLDLELLDSWKGSARGPLTVVQPGGELDGVGQRVAGVAELAPGEEVVLFLERQGQFHRTVGLGQGVYRVERGGGAAQAMPAATPGLSLVAPNGSSLQPRQPMSLETLEGEVRREVRRE
jgi:hypothetical protein